MRHDGYRLNCCPTEWLWGRPEPRDFRFAGPQTRGPDLPLSIKEYSTLQSVLNLYNQRLVLTDGLHFRSLQHAGNYAVGE